METTLEVRGLCKSFDGVPVLREVSFALGAGEIVALLGDSGGGKTTLLRCLNFLETPDAGSITVRGQEVFCRERGERRERRQSAALLRERQRMFGLVFQQFQLFPHYTVLRNLTLAPSLERGGRHRREELERRAREQLTVMGLADRADAYPDALSGGQQQRVAIARSLMASPAVLCLDEPTSALDPRSRADVMRVIRSLRSDGRAILVVTHDLSLAAGVADRILFLSEGALVESGSAARMLSEPQSEPWRRFLAAAPRAGVSEMSDSETVSDGAFGM